MGDGDYTIDERFLLSWKEDPRKFKFYLEKPSSASLTTLSIMFYSFILFINAEALVLLIIDNTSIISESSYVLFKNLFIRDGLIVLCVFCIVALGCFMFDFLVKKPRFKINKKLKVYITDNSGLYIIDYIVCTRQSSSMLPNIASEVVNYFEDHNVKLEEEFFASVSYLENYNIIRSSKDYVVLDVPSDSPIYDDVNDFEITSAVIGFEELRGYIDDTEGGYYLD